MSPETVAGAVVACVVTFALGYAVRGWVRKEIGIAAADAKKFAGRLEAAVAADIRALL